MLVLTWCQKWSSCVTCCILNKQAGGNVSLFQTNVRLSLQRKDWNACWFYRMLFELTDLVFWEPVLLLLKVPCGVFDQQWQLGFCQFLYHLCVPDAIWILHYAFMDSRLADINAKNAEIEVLHHVLWGRKDIQNICLNVKNTPQGTFKWQ